MMINKILTTTDTSDKKLAMWNGGPGLPKIRILHKDAEGKCICTDLNDLTQEEMINLANFLLEVAAKI